MRELGASNLCRANLVPIKVLMRELRKKVGERERERGKTNLCSTLSENG